MVRIHQSPPAPVHDMAGAPMICYSCEREFEYDRDKGHRKNHCRQCIARETRKNVKQKAIDLKGGKCILCGYDKCVEALQFHHRDPSQKEFTISSPNFHKWEDVEKELEKCDLLCSNCHAEVHAGIIILPTTVM